MCDVSQAPESMKSVMQAAWLLTTAFGDVIVVIVAGIKLFSQVTDLVAVYTVILCRVSAELLSVHCSRQQACITLIMHEII